MTLFDKCECLRGGDAQDTLYGKTSLEHSVATTGWILEPCLRKSDRPKFQCLNVTSGRKAEWCNATSAKLRGECWTLNIGESPRDARESSLSQILQATGDVPEKYFLTPIACKGILRRAKERGKPAPDSRRYKAIGNGMAHPCADYIIRRIVEVSENE